MTVRDRVRGAWRRWTFAYPQGVALTVRFELSRSDTGVARARIFVEYGTSISDVLADLLRQLAERAEQPDAHPGRQVMPSMDPADYSLHLLDGQRILSFERPFAKNHETCVLVYRPVMEWVRRKTWDGSLKAEAGSLSR